MKIGIGKRKVSARALDAFTDAESVVLFVMWFARKSHSKCSMLAGPLPLQIPPSKACPRAKHMCSTEGLIANMFAGPQPRAVLCVAVLEWHVAIGMDSGHLFIYSIEPFLDALAQRNKRLSCCASSADATGLSNVLSGAFAASTVDREIREHYTQGCWLARGKLCNAACRLSVLYDIVFI
jgi:hypothetical protein